jgi:hypothetical protein
METFVFPVRLVSAGRALWQMDYFYHKGTLRPALRFTKGQMPSFILYNNVYDPVGNKYYIRRSRTSNPFLRSFIC